MISISKVRWLREHRDDVGWGFQAFSDKEFDTSVPVF